MVHVFFLIKNTNLTSNLKEVNLYIFRFTKRQLLGFGRYEERERERVLSGHSFPRPWRGKLEKIKMN